MKNFAFSTLALIAWTFTAVATAAPVLTPEKLSAEIGQRIERVPEFAFIREEAEKMGVKVYLFGGTAAAYSHYVREDMLREAGDTRFPAMRFDYDYTNIFRSTQDLDVVIDGTAAQATELQSALGRKFPHFIGDKGAGWEVRPLKTDLADKEAILDNPNFLNQHTDSHSTGTVEITKTEKGVSPVRDVRDWKSREPQFLRDVAEARLHYYFNPLHETTTRAQKGLNPAILSVIRYLTKAFQYGLEIRKEDLPQIRRIISDFDPKSLDNDYLRRWVEKNGKKLFQHALNLERAWDTLEELGLRRKLMAVSGNADVVDSMAWWLNKEPLRTRPIGEGAGTTAAEIAKSRNLPKLITAHETNSYLAYESITRQRGGELNALISRTSAVGEAAVFGEGFYSRVGRQGARGTGLTIRMEIDPRAREGTDFTFSHDFLVIKNKAAAKVIAEQIDISMPEYFRMLANNKSFSSDDRALVEQFHRRAAKHQALSPEDEKTILAIVLDEIKRPKPRESVLNEWFRIPVSAQHPEIVEQIMRNGGNKSYQYLAKEVLGQRKWAERTDIVQKLIDSSDATVHRSLFEYVFSQPHFASRAEIAEQFFSSEKTVGNNRAPYYHRDRGPSTQFGPDAWLAQNLSPAWAEHPELVRKAIEQSQEYSQSRFAEKMADAAWADQPQLLRTLIEGKDQGTLNSIASKTLRQEAWAKHPELLSRLIELADQEALARAAELFALPKWRSHQDIQKKLYLRSKPEARMKLAQALGPKSEIHSLRSDVLTAIEKGPPAARMLAAETLTSPEWWQEKDLMRALLGSADAKAIQRVAMELPREYLEKNPEVLDGLIRSPKLKVQQAIITNIYHRSETAPSHIPALGWLYANGDPAVVSLAVNGIESDQMDFIKAIVARQNNKLDNALVSHVLIRPDWKFDPDIVRTIVQRGNLLTIETIVSYLFSDPGIPGQREVLREIIENGNQKILWAAVTHLFQWEPWKSQTDLMVLLFEKANDSVIDTLNVYFHQLPWEKEKAILEEVIARGKPTGLRNVARVLPSLYSNIEEKTERMKLSKKLARLADPEASKMMAKMMRQVSWKPDSELAELLKNPPARSCSAGYASLIVSP